MPALRRVAERPGKYAKPRIDALISGKLHAHPEQRTSKTGKTYATAKMTAAGGDGQSLFVNCIAFDEASVEALLALVAGDSLAVAGSITPKVWTDRDGQHRPALDMVVARVLTAYHVTHKRRAMQQSAAPKTRQQSMDDGEPLDF